MSDLAVRRTVLCPRCSREMMLQPMIRANGRVVVEMRCPKHGTFPRGWREAFIPAMTPIPRKGTR